MKMREREKAGGFASFGAQHRLHGGGAAASLTSGASDFISNAALSFFNLNSHQIELYSEKNAEK